MRQVVRFFIVGSLILSCFGEGLTGPPPCSSPVDTLFRLAPAPGSVRLSIGSASMTSVDYFSVQCQAFVADLPASQIAWTLRDSSLVELRTSVPDISGHPKSRFVVPARSGTTFLVVTAPGLSDSVQIIVLDSTVMGAVTELAAGGAGSCAVTDDASALCWGTVPENQLTGVNVGNCVAWATCSPMPVRVKTGVRSIHVEGTRYCTLDDDGGAWCSGGGLQGGDAVPGGRAFSALVLGWAHTCGVATDGKGYCWGSGPSGQLGSSSSSSNTPVAVLGGHVWQSLSVRNDMTCGVSDSGRLYCWGILGQSDAQVPGATRCTFSSKEGTYTQPCAWAPIPMPLQSAGGDSNFVEVARGCARTAGGAIYCHNAAVGVFAEQSGMRPFTGIVGGGNHWCGLDADGTAWCWGANEFGQLGDGTIQHRFQPVRVSGEHRFIRLAAGSTHTCGVTDARDAWCWGANNLGQAGTSVLERPRTPVRVRGQQ